MIPLDQLEVVVLDCQTTGASPKHGHLLELAWSVGRAADPDWPPVHSHLVRLPDGQRIPPRIAKLTGIRDADLDAALPPAETSVPSRGSRHPRRLAVSEMSTPAYPRSPVHRPTQGKQGDSRRQGTLIRPCLAGRPTDQALRRAAGADPQRQGD